MDEKEKIIRAERTANNNCQGCLIFSLVIGFVITSIISIFVNADEIALLMTDSVITFTIWRIWIKHYYGSDAFEG